MIKKVYLLMLAIVIGCVLIFAGTTWAIPALQMYIEGASYDSVSDTWVLDPVEDDSFKLWTIGNVGAVGTIYNVRLAVAYEDPGEELVSITLTPGTTGGYAGFTDTSTPIAPTYIQTVDDGSSPILSNGSSLGPHGIFGEGTEWQEFLLGNFDSTDSPIGDFGGSVPAIGTNPPMGQINVYEVAVTGTSVVHFDLYDFYESNNLAKAVFAPYSHDSEANVPEPATAFLLLGLMIFGFLPLMKKRDF